MLFNKTKQYYIEMFNQIIVFQDKSKLQAYKAHKTGFKHLLKCKIYNIERSVSLGPIFRSAFLPCILMIFFW